jgi:cell division protein FtsB
MPRDSHTTSRRGRSRRTNATKAGSSARARLILLGGVVVSVVVLFAWFPAGSLLTQRSSLAATELQLSTLHKQDAALTQEQKNLSDAGEIGRIAREQYQLVSPGQQSYEVLPPSGAPAAGTPYAGDPGTVGPVTPSATAELPPGAGSTTPTPSSSAERVRSDRPASPSAGSGLLSRMVDTLEFWR